MSDKPAPTLVIKEAVALELVRYARHVADTDFKDKDELLDFYAECLDAVNGRRSKAASTVESAD